MIELKNVSKFYTNNGVTSLGLKSINLKLNRNEIVAICGESGSGKSTLLNVITKIDTFDDGEIYIDNEETSYFDISDMDNFRKNKVGFIFQNYNIIESYDVLNNVMLPLIINGMNKKEAKKRALELIEKVGLSHRIHNKGSHLSGGEKQRCVIARALASNCEILACDEPTGNLDSETSKEIIKLIKEVSKDKIVLIVTHNFDEVKDIVNRKITLFDGEIVRDDVYESVPDDNKHYQESEDLIVSKKALFHIALSNLKYTPKKTIFISLIFILLSLILTLSLSSISISQDGLHGKNNFPNAIENRIYVYNQDEPIAKEFLDNNFKNQYAANPFEVNNRATLDGIENYWISAYYEPSFSEKDLKYGRMPENDNEIAINFSHYPLSQIKTYLNKTIRINMYFNESYGEFKIVGVCSSSSRYCALFGNNKLQKAMRYNSLKLSLNPILLNDTKFSNAIDVVYEKDGENKLVVNSSLDISNYRAILYNKTNASMKFSFDLSKVKIEVNENISSCKLYLNDQYELDKILSAFVYCNGNKADAIKLITDNGYIAIDTYNYVERNLATNLSELGITSIIFSVIVTALLAYFISYAILRIAYKSRIHDYNIIRTLGVTNRYMKSIVTYELLVSSLITSIIIFIVSKIVGECSTDPFLMMLNKLDLKLFIIYILAIIIFSYLLSVGFNKKLFKFSVSKQFEGRGK